MVVPLGAVVFHSLTRQGSMVLTSVRRIIALKMSFTSMSFLDIDGTTATTSETISLVQAWNSFIGNIETVGRDTRLDKLTAARNKFEQKSITGARFKLHRLSRETGLPFLSWRAKCQRCIKNSVRTPREASLPNQPYWRAHISSEMYKKN